jgi:hypothetical protein
MNRYRVIGYLIGITTSIVLLLISFVVWGEIGFATEVWVDGCPDIVAAHIEAYGPSPKWWEIIFLFVIPPIFISLSICCGMLARRFILRFQGKINT